MKPPAAIGGLNLPVNYAGPADDNVPGLDQINVRLTTELKSNHRRRLVVTVDGVSTNRAFVTRRRSL